MEARMRKEKLLFNGFMESFNLSVLLRFIGIVLDDGDAAGDTVLSKPSPIAVIYPYSLNREGSNVQEVVNEVTGSNKGFTFVESSIRPPRAVINRIDAHELPASPVREAPVELQLNAWLF